MKDYMQSHSYRYIATIMYLRENNVQACVFHVECNAAWDFRRVSSRGGPRGLAPPPRN